MSCGGKDFRDYGIDVRVFGAVVHDASSKAKLVAQHRIREVNLPVPDDALEQIRVEAVQVFA